MKHISIAIPLQGALISSVVRLFKIFNTANACTLQKGKLLPFELHIVADADVVDLYGGHFTLKPNLRLKDVLKTDLVIIPALAGNIAEGLQKDQRLKAWIRKQYHNGAEIACLCTSFFLLPGTGLLEKRHCGKKWFVANEFRQQFRQINLVAEKAVVDEEDVYTNGGAYSFIDCMIEISADSKTAIACSTIFETEFNRECQSLAVIKNEQQTHHGLENKKNTRRVVNDSSRAITPWQFAAMLHLNREDPLDDSLYNHIMDDNNAAKESEDAFPLQNMGSINTTPYNNSKIFKEIFGMINKL